MINAIVLAGGLGTRLRKVVSNVPKPLAPINGVAFLDLLIRQIEQSKIINQIILAIGYRADAIVEHFSHRKNQIKIEFSFEDQPLGTGGAVKKAMALVNTQQVFVLNGDSYLQCSLSEMAQKYRAPLTMAYTYVAEASRFGQLKIDADGRIEVFREKEAGSKSGFINGGIYLFDSQILRQPMPDVFSLEKNLFPELLLNGIYGFFVDGCFIDIGTPESYLKAQLILKELTK